MTLEQLRKIIYTGREIEFTYQDKNYSLTYFRNNGGGGKKWLSFCEFYKDTLDVSDVDSLLKSTYHGIKVSDIFESLGENDYSLF
jgi:hypothetical protein